MRCLLLAVVIFTTVLRAHLAWCESTARSPTVVVAALIYNDPANADIEATADEVATALHIDRPALAQRWHSFVRDQYVQPPWNEITDAQREVYELCALPAPNMPAPPQPERSNALEQAARTLYQVTNATSTGSAGHAAACLRRPNHARDKVNVHVYADDDRQWTLFANGVDVFTRKGNDTTQIEIEHGERLYLYARCGDPERCSRTVEVDDPARPVTIYIDAVPNRQRGQMSETSLSLTYSSELVRNNNTAFDSALVSYVLGKAWASRGDAITVMSEGPDVRLVYSDEDGTPIRTIRTARADVVDGALRIAAGRTEPAIGAPAAGKHRVVVDVEHGAPRVTDLRSPLDRIALPGRAFCKANRCAFAAPKGTLHMRIAEEGESQPVDKKIDLDEDKLVTIHPGRRYWAKYTGIGMMGVGGAGVVTVLLLEAVKKGIGDAVDSAIPDSGPEGSSSDDNGHAPRWEGITFLAGAGLIAAGAVLTFVVHKPAHISVSPLGGAVFKF